VKVLEAIKNKNLRAAWRFGSWDIEFGTFFSELSSAKSTSSTLPHPAALAVVRLIDTALATAAAWGFWVSDDKGTSTSLTNL